MPLRPPRAPTNHHARWRRRVLWTLTAACVIAVCTALALDVRKRPTEPRLRGPFGSGDAQVWVLLPPGAATSVVVFAHGWWDTSGPPREWLARYRPWLNHLAVRGAAVIFPRYQIDAGSPPDLSRVVAYRAALTTAFARLHPPRSEPVISVGYSFGGGLALAYAGRAAAWHLPQPIAVDEIFPIAPIAGVGPLRFPAHPRVIVMVGDQDAVVGAGGASVIWPLFAGLPRTARRYVVVRSRGTFHANHNAPKGSSDAAQAAFWTPLDQLISAVSAAPPLAPPEGAAIPDLPAARVAAPQRPRRSGPDQPHSERV